MKLNITIFGKEFKDLLLFTYCNNSIDSTLTFSLIDFHNMEYVTDLILLLHENDHYRKNKVITIGNEKITIKLKNSDIQYLELY